MSSQLAPLQCSEVLAASRKCGIHSFVHPESKRFEDSADDFTRWQSPPPLLPSFLCYCCRLMCHRCALQHVTCKLFNFRVSPEVVETEGRIPVGFSFQFATEHGLLSCVIPRNCWLCARAACSRFSHRTTPARPADTVTPTSSRHFFDMRALCGLAALALCGVADAGQTPCLATGKGPVSCEVCADVSLTRAPDIDSGVAGAGFSWRRRLCTSSAMDNGRASPLLMHTGIKSLAPYP